VEQQAGKENIKLERAQRPLMTVITGVCRMRVAAQGRMPTAQKDALK
jgi:hypothetical protein